MTTLLEKAFSEIQKLSASDQDTIAAVTLEELADEHRWDEAFAKSQDQLARIAKKVKDDIQVARIRKMTRDER